MFLSTRRCKTASEDIFEAMLAAPKGKSASAVLGPSGLNEALRRYCSGLLRGQVPLLLKAEISS